MDIEERLKQLQNKLDSRVNDIQQRSNSTLDSYGVQSTAPTFTANTAGNSFCPQCGASVENDAMFCNIGRDIEVNNENGEYSDRGIDDRYCEEYYVNSFNDSRDSEKNDIDNICDLLQNMIVEDEDGNELVDTSDIDSKYTDMLISALEKWLGDELYMKFGEDELEDVDTEDFVDDIMMNRSCVRRELVKFACIVSQGDEPETEGNKMLEWPESLDYDAEYTIKFPNIEMEFTWTGSDDE